LVNCLLASVKYFTVDFIRKKQTADGVLFIVESGVEGTFVCVLIFEEKRWSRTASLYTSGFSSWVTRFFFLTVYSLPSASSRFRMDSGMVGGGGRGSRRATFTLS